MQKFTSSGKTHVRCRTCYGLFPPAMFREGNRSCKLCIQYLSDDQERQENSMALDTQVGGDHYKSLAIQPIEYILKNKLGWCEGNIIKYATRHSQKGQAADLDKVIHYAQLAKQLYYNK